MTPDTTNLIDRIDRDRSEHEELLFLLLLAFLRQARNRADSALALGISPYNAVADVLTGNRLLGMPGAAARIARRLIAADVAGYRRTVRVAGDMAEAEGYVPVTDYGSRSRQAVAKMLGTLQSRIADALREAAGKGNGATRKAVAEAFERGGYVESASNKAWLLSSSAVTLVGFAYGSGWWNGWQRPSVAGRLRGFRYSSVLDVRTTDICRAYHGTKLPIDHPWWQTHWSPNHFNCRAVVVPVWAEFTPTEPVWNPAPMPGFGAAPAMAMGLRYTRVA